MKFVTLFLISILIVCSSLQAAEFRKGNFDYYVLALSWQPAFCQNHQNKPECRHQTTDDVSAKHFSLHGLWPNKKEDKAHRYAYCGVAGADRSRDKKGQWCALGNTYINNELKEKMPGVVSCLQMHEWVKHGSCSALSIDDYFSSSLELLDDFNQTRFAHLVGRSTGKEISKRQLIETWVAEFPQNKNTLSLVCRKIAGKSYLTEVRLKLRKALKESLSASLDSNAKPYSRCGSMVYIDAAGFN